MDFAKRQTRCRGNPNDDAEPGAGAFRLLPDRAIPVALSTLTEAQNGFLMAAL